MKERDKARVDAIQAKLVEQFRNGSAIGSMAKSLIPMSPDAPMHTRSYRNRMLAMICCGTADVRTGKQWNEVGRTITKGKRCDTDGVWLLRPNLYPEKDDNGQPVKDANGKQVYRCFGYSTYAAFPYGATEGQPLAEYEPQDMPELAEVASRWGIPVVYQGGGARAYGSYTLGGKAIDMYTHDKRTFWHELAHAGHEKVMAQRGGKLVGGQDAKQEIVAEFCSAVLAEFFGYCDAHGASVDYVARYAGGQENVGTLLMQCLSDASAVLDLILGSR